MALPSVKYEAPAGRRTREWAVALLGAASAGVLAIPVLTLARLPWSLLLLFLIVPAAQLALTPVWRQAGIYRYHSPALFVVERGGDRFEVHGGTAYDYLLQMRWDDRGVPAQRLLLDHYLAGLIGVIEDVESGHIPTDARITATSYFFSARNAERLGFTVRQPSGGEVLHAALDVVSLTAMYSYVRGRPSLPRIWKMKQAVITAGELARRKRAVQALRAGLSRSVDTPASG